MAVPIYGGLKCEWILNLDDSLSIVFLMVLEIFNNEFAHSIFKYKLENKFEYKLRGIQYSGASFWHYWL